MTSVGSWDPDSSRVAIDAQLVARLLRAASHLEDDELGLEPAEVGRFAPLMRRRRAEWQAAVANLGDVDIEALIRFFALAEERLPDWGAGAQSPVIALAAVLRQRGTYPKALTKWLRQVSRNRYLPWGSLADRL
jgi:hypothetical protein